MDRRQVAVVGHSFGGSLTLLVAERDRSLRAAINFASAAGSWEGSADLRARLIAAVGRLTAPVFSFTLPTTSQSRLAKCWMLR